MKFSRETGYIFLTAVPTPNGALHLGHIAGPYLTADVTKRAFERGGAHCLTACGADSFDSYVEMTAEREHRSCEEICHQYTKQIRSDLELLNIAVDYFLDPLSPGDDVLLSESTNEWLSTLSSQKRLMRSVETLPVDDTGEYVGTCFIRGLCPGCGRVSGGFGCETCFEHYRPENLTQLSSLRHEHIAMRQFEVLRAVGEDGSSLSDYMKRTAVPDAFQVAVMASWRRFGGHLRVSVPDRRGMPVPHHLGVAGQVIHPGFQLLPFAHAVCRQLTSLIPGSPSILDADSRYEILRFAGGDGAVTHVLNGWLATLAGIPTYSSFVFNHFYELEGKKFSTSRGHAIWVKEAIEVHALVPDALRLYLAKTAPIFNMTNFSGNDFIAFYDQFLVSTLNSLFDRSDQDLLGPSAAEWVEIEKQMAYQLHLLERLPPDVPAASCHFVEWVSAQAPTLSWSGAQLGFALLASPFMPCHARDVWHSLGYEGDPRAPSRSLPLRSSVATGAHAFGFPPLTLAQREFLGGYIETSEGGG
jgi:methionyl-tRNA synthetase